MENKIKSVFTAPLNFMNPVLVQVLGICSALAVTSQLKPALVVVGAVRELLGRGTLLGFEILPKSVYEMGYLNNGTMTMPAMALILIGVVIWIHRAYFYKEEK